MSKSSYPVPKSNPHLETIAAFFLTWFASATIITIASALFPKNVVLGTISLSHWEALLLSSGVLSWLMTLSIVLFTEVEVRQQRVLSPKDWLMGYFALNTVGIWLIARLAEILGLGLSSWLVALLLGLVLSFAQGSTMMAYGAFKNSRK